MTDTVSVEAGIREDDNALRREIVHRFGLAQPTGPADHPVVCCLVRDGEYWLPAFLDHYRRLGAREFFFLDNDSEDGTLDLLRDQSDVGVFSVKRSLFKHFNTHLRRLLVTMVRPEGWVLGVDIDEFFDYPFADQVGLGQLCGYLDERRYDAMSSHQLDMFPAGPINERSSYVSNDPRKDSPYYSLKGLRFNNYECAHVILDGVLARKLVLPYSNWKFFYDGLRFRVFGVDIWLTKHALFRTGGELIPYLHAHIHLHMRVADISSVLYHYKFTPLLGRQIETALREKQYCDDSSDYIHYGNRLDSGDQVIVNDGSAKKLNSVDDLLDPSFLEASERYKTCFGIAR
ncbi:MAG: glycosyltransferase family 2 protein [Gammaproteobacteria bacterium]|nr:glycosyltransferase family 2 protein [Gammaproteobacteria bacterium]